MNLRRLHRGLSLWAAITVIGWALSGLSHPLMSLLGPRAATFQPPSPVVAPLPEGWARDLAGGGVDALSGLRQVLLGDELWLQIHRAADHPPQYARDASGPYLGRDADYAAQLARHYMGAEDADEGRVVAADYLTTFSARYPDINRVLPVWRLQFDDGREVDVSTLEDRLIGITDGRRRVLSAVFRNVHTLAPLERWPWLRVGLMSLLLLATWGVALAGLRLLWQPGARRGLRRMHRIGGAVLLLPLLAWTMTGAFHLLHYAFKPAWTDVASETLPSTAMMAVAETPVRRLLIHDATAWALDADGFYTDGATRLSPVEMAQTIAGVPGEVSLVTRFGNDYGFTNRRLPVWRVVTDEGHRHFVDLGLGQVVANVSPLDRAELWSFNQIHKWQLADGLGRVGRDAVMSLFAFLLLVLAGVGLRLRLRRMGR